MEGIRKLLAEGHDTLRKLLLQQSLQQRLGKHVGVAGVAAAFHAQAQYYAKSAHDRLLLLLTDSKRLHAVVEPKARCLTFGLPREQKQRLLTVGVQSFLHKHTQPIIRQPSSVSSSLTLERNSEAVGHIFIGY